MDAQTSERHEGFCNACESRVRRTWSKSNCWDRTGHRRRRAHEETPSDAAPESPRPLPPQREACACAVSSTHAALAVWAWAAHCVQSRADRRCGQCRMALAAASVGSRAKSRQCTRAAGLGTSFQSSARGRPCAGCQTSRLGSTDWSVATRQSNVQR